MQARSILGVESLSVFSANEISVSVITSHLTSEELILTINCGIYIPHGRQPEHRAKLINLISVKF